jgi:hypothetical protein
LTMALIIKEIIMFLKNVEWPGITILNLFKAACVRLKKFFVLRHIHFFTSGQL